MLSTTYLAPLPMSPFYEEWVPYYKKILIDRDQLASIYQAAIVEQRYGLCPKREVFYVLGIVSMSKITDFS